jgi:hypothetical protein
MTFSPQLKELYRVSTQPYFEAWGEIRRFMGVADIKSAYQFIPDQEYGT